MGCSSSHRKITEISSFFPPKSKSHPFGALYEHLEDGELLTNTWGHSSLGYRLVVKLPTNTVVPVSNVAGRSPKATLVDACQQDRDISADGRGQIPKS